MIYTQEQVDGMSELDKRVAATQKAFDVDGWDLSIGIDDGCFYHCGTDGNQFFEQPLLKLEPNDIMPIAFEHGISVISKATVDGKYRASTGSIISPSVMTRNTNPLIAIVDVFLMMEV